MPVILESIVTTLNPDGTTNIAPMGPEVDERMERVVLKPFRDSTTYHNIQRTGSAVLHVTDDVLLLAQAAVGTPAPFPRTRPCDAVPGTILLDACRWHALRCTDIDESSERPRIRADVVAGERVRDFFGLNRAKHAVVEAAILATRVHLLPAEEITAEFERLRPLIAKTGGEQESEAFRLLERHVELHAAAPLGHGPTA